MKKERTGKQAIENPLIPQRFQHATAITVIFLSLVVFFHSLVFDGKVFLAADNIASKSFETYLSDTEKLGEFPLWNPYIFCGMPGYASLMVHGERYFDVSALLINRASKLFGAIINSPDVGWGLFYYLILGIGMYWFAYDKVKDKVAALLAGLAVMHSTFIIILVMVGHMTKVPVVAFFPFIFMILERLRARFSWPMFLSLIVLVHFMLLPGHIQMIFYCYLAFGLYYLFFLVRAVMQKEDWKGILRSGLVFTAATVLAFAMTGDQYLSTLEYSKYSMRGADAIVPSAQQQQQGGSNGGLDYDYATNWSFSPGEMLTFFIPSTHGFGFFQYTGPLSPNQEIRLNTYFGNMPFTDAPQYMGILVLVLAGIGVWKNRKDPFVQYAALLMFLSLLVSFGKELSFAYDLLFNYFPMFNKFRIPSMILILVQLMVPVMAAYGVATLVKEAGEKDSSNRKGLEYALIGIGMLLILAIVAKDVFVSLYESFFSPQDAMQSLARSYGTNPAVLKELFNTVTSMVATDIAVGAFILTAGIGAIYLFTVRRISKNVLSVVLVVLVLGDLWRVNAKPMDAKPGNESSEYFATPSYVSFMKQDTSLYRVLEFENGQPPYNNTLAYWRIQSAYGYSGTKMRQVQDMFDVAGLGNPLMWGLMNVKYILSDRKDSNGVMVPVFGDQGHFVHYNRAVLPRAFFVNRYEVAKGLEILNKIKAMSFEPRDVAFFMEDPSVKIDAPQAGAAVDVTHYSSHEISMAVKATGNNLLYVSEAWYPEGWTATLDGSEIAIHRVNYMFRGFIVPAGQHTLTMRFEPKGFIVGRSMSLVINLLVIVGLCYFSFVVYRRRTVVTEV